MKHNIQNVIEDEERDPFDYERIIKFHGRNATAHMVKLALARINHQISSLLNAAGPFVIPVDGRLWIAIKLGITQDRPIE